MSAVFIGTVSIALICLLIYGGVHIAIALCLSSFVGVWLIKGDLQVAGNVLALAAGDSISNYDFAVVPLFVIMGLLVGISNVGQDAFNAASQMLRRIKGGVGVATVLGNAILSAVTGVTIASTAIFTKIAVPEMLRLGYRPRFAVGIVAGSSVLGMVIPPSLLMIIYGIITETSIGKLFIAGMVPGILLTVLLSLTVVVCVWKFPGFAGVPVTPSDEERMHLKQLARAVVPILVLLVFIFGGIYGGIFTPTEAGATGAAAAFGIALQRRTLSWRKLWQLVGETGMITAAVLILVIAANMYSRMLALSGLPDVTAQWITGLGAGLTVTLFAYILLLLFLGTFLDSASTVLLAVPLAVPVFAAWSVDMVWLGLITIVATEMGIVTPPLGIAVFVVKSTLNDPSISLTDIYVGSYPFLVVMFLTLLAMVLFPGIVTAFV